MIRGNLCSIVLNNEKTSSIDPVQTDVKQDVWMGYKLHAVVDVAYIAEKWESIGQIYHDIK